MGGFGMFVLWMALAFAVGVLAQRKHRSGLGWFLLAVLISPLIAGVFALVMAPLADPDAVKCPRCAEAVKKDALVCKHCGGEMRAPAAAPAGPASV